MKLARCRARVAAVLCVMAAAGPAAAQASWERLPDLPVGVAKFGVAALAGRLHITGGYDTLRTHFVLDLASGSWTGGAPLPRGTDNVATITAQDRVLAVGGEAGRALQVFDPQADAWTLGPAIPNVRFASAVAVLGAQVHVVGGWNANNRASASLASHDVFDLATQAWRPGGAAPMPTARNAAVAGSLGGRLYVAGGRAPGIRANDQQALATLEAYDPASDTWATLPPLPTARAGAAGVVLAGQFCVLGGEAASGPSDVVECFDPAAGRWLARPPLPYRAHGLGAVVAGGALYVMGGFTGRSDAVGSESRALYRLAPATP